MKKTVLITGSTDGIGLETAKKMVNLGHNVLVHGRSNEKLAKIYAVLSSLEGTGNIDTYRADLSEMSDVESLAKAVMETHTSLDVLINNAGVFKMPNPISRDGFDQRFIVNSVAPYLLTLRLLPLMPSDGRIINLSSAAQSTVDFEAFAGHRRLNDNQAYAQSKLALTMWSFQEAKSLKPEGPAIIAVNPSSFLASKMVKTAYGVEGHDLGIGAEILVRAALSDEFANASGRYYDNDKRQFSHPHPDALDDEKNRMLVSAIEDVLRRLGTNPNS